MRVEQLLNPLSLLVCKSGCLDLIFLLVALVIERADAVRDRYRAFRLGNLSGDSLELAALKDVGGLIFVYICFHGKNNSLSNHCQFS